MAKFSTTAVSKKYASIFNSSKKGTKYSASSFWMDDDFLEDIEDKRKGVDIVKLSGYRRAIGNFVRIVTNRDDIPVNYTATDASFTNGKQVTISAKLNENEFDSTVGLALHEGSHILLTNFDTLREFVDRYWDRSSPSGQYTLDEIQSIKDLTNIIEDRRIDNYVYRNAPGYRSYYQALYDRYFNSKDIDKALQENIWSEETYDNYLNHICNFANPNRNLNALSGLKEIWAMIDIKNIGRLQSTADSLEIAKRVYDTILKYVDKAAAKPQDPNNGTEGDEGEEHTGSSSGEGAGGNQATQPFTPKDQAKLDRLKKAADKAREAQKKFLNGNIKKGKLSRKDASALKAAQDSSMTYAEVGGKVPSDAGENHTIGSGTTKCLVVRGMPDSLMEGGYSVLNHITSMPTERVKEHFKRSGGDPIEDGMILGTLLGKRLKTRDEIRTLTSTRLAAGSLDKRLVSELGYGNDRVFYKKIVDTIQPALVHISIDASGSMSGRNWNKALKTAVAIAKATSMTQSLQCVISVRGSHGNYPVMWVVYDSRKDGLDVIRNKFYAIDANGSTPEGLCFQAIMKEIIDSAKGKDMYFINLSDGEPGYSNGEFSYGGEYALTHTKTQIDKMIRAGINVISYFICDANAGSWIDHSKRKFKKMYGAGARFIDVESLNQLAVSLNSLFERKAA